MKQPAGPSFRNDVLPMFTQSCVDSGCHGDHPTESVSLDLRPDNAWRQLVNAPAQARKGARRVRPGSPDDSFLVAKMTGALGAKEGKRMPLDSQTGAPLPPTPQTGAWVTQVLEPWIRAGALDN